MPSGHGIELDTLGKVISANLTRAVLDLAPVIADASTGLAELAKDAGVAYEQLKLLAQGDTNFEGLSLRSTKAVVEDLRDDVRGLRAERDALGDGIIDDLRRRWVEWRLDRKSQALQQWQAKLAWLQRDADKAKGPGPAPVDTTSTPDTIETETKSAEDRARRLTKIENDLQRQLFETTHQGAERVKAEHNKLVEELRSLAAPDGSDATKIETMIERSAALRDARLAQLGEQERRAAEKRREANDKVLEGLRAEREQLILTDRERFVGQALQRLSAEATDEQRRAVEEHAGALYDEREALEARDRVMEKGRSLTESLRTESEKVAAEIAELNDLLRAGAIDQETYARAMEQTRDRMLRTSREWTDGVKRALRDYADEATDAARAAEEVTTTALQGMEDALVQFASTGKVEFQSLADSIMADITRIAVRQSITGPLASVLGGSMGAGAGGGLFGGGGGGLFGAGGGGPSGGGGGGPLRRRVKSVRPVP